jgi:hypothetical protein
MGPLDEREYPLKWTDGHTPQVRTGINEVTTLTCECDPATPLQTWGDPDEVCILLPVPSNSTIQKAIDAHLADIQGG